MQWRLRWSKGLRFILLRRRWGNSLHTLNDVERIERYICNPSLLDNAGDVVYGQDMAAIRGQEHVKRALEVAASGGHNVLMSGPPGSGKTLLARAVPSILPRMVIEEALDVTKIYSVSGMLAAETPLLRQRPFRAPHHTISHAGLVGGGRIPHPQVKLVGSSWCSFAG